VGDQCADGVVGPRSGRPEPVEVFVGDGLDLHAVGRLGAVLDATARHRPIRLVVDLAGCRNVDAAGISLLLDAHRRLSRAGGQVVLCRSAAPAAGRRGRAGGGSSRAGRVRPGQAATGVRWWAGR
jgi:hypothetical protein